LQRTDATWDVLGAESQGQIGFVFSQVLASVGQPTAAVLTQVEVAANDPAFKDPAKLVGPVYTVGVEAEGVAKENPTWVLKPDGDKYMRRCVPSPKPLRILQLDAVKALLAARDDASGAMPLLPIACGGGGVPVVRKPDESFEGVEAVIDKDHCGALLAASLGADGFIILTDGGGIWENFGKPKAREMAEASCEYLQATKAGKAFPGSMGPKVEAAINFVKMSAAAGKPDAWAAIGDLRDAEGIVAGTEGTLIKDTCQDGVVWRAKK